MALPTRPPKNGFNAFARRIYNPIGFAKAYNFILWFVFAGGLFGFALARFMYLNFAGIFCPAGGSKDGDSAAPGECYWYRTFPWYKTGIMLHLAGILPASILVVLQFTPVIRHKAIIVHRAGSIITNRIILISSANIISAIGSYYTVWPCAKIAFTLRSNETAQSLYPECASYANGSNPYQQAMVHADFGSGLSTELGAALNMCFGMALWVALALHAIGIEVYLHLTPKEAERLRNVSYQRQLEAGMKRPGSAGLTLDRLGDSDEWIPPGKEREHWECTSE
ncbi:hypothetical protein N0V90_011845 [Kalmusia sp. IMI 367209]|nr:hypothetical protein N0V90_011845 [Kalmusia sp. IMI 367209]